MLAVPMCPPIPRLTLLQMSIVVAILLVCDLVLLVGTLRWVLQGAAARAVEVGIVTAGTIVGALTLSMLTFIVFLAVHDNYLLLSGCMIPYGDPVAERDMRVFHELETIVVAIPLVALVVTVAAVLFARLAQPRHAR